MNAFKNIAILFLMVTFQASFIRLSNFFAFAPNLPVIALFILSYRLKFSDIMILALAAGLLIDLFSAVNFGVSSLALIIAFAANRLLKKTVLRARTFTGTMMGGFSLFFCFYFLLIILDNFFNPATSGKFGLEMFGSGVFAEVSLNSLLALALYYFLSRYSANKYGNIWNYGKSVKISS